MKKSKGIWNYFGGRRENRNSEKNLYDQGLDVISLMVEATRSEDYIEVYTSSTEIMDIVQDIGEGDFKKTKAVYSITVKGDSIKEMKEFFGDADVIIKEVED